jgi:hypothetical protein
MKATHYLVIGLLVIGLLYLYHTTIANPGGLKTVLSGLGINR